MQSMRLNSMLVLLLNCGLDSGKKLFVRNLNELTNSWCTQDLLAAKWKMLSPRSWSRLGMSLDRVISTEDSYSTASLSVISLQVKPHFSTQSSKLIINYKCSQTFWIKAESSPKAQTRILLQLPETREFPREEATSSDLSSTRIGTNKDRSEAVWEHPWPPELLETWMTAFWNSSFTPRFPRTRSKRY